MYIIYLSKPIENGAPRMSPNINCGLWVVQMYHPGVELLVTEALYGVRGIRELYVLPIQFCCLFQERQV